MFKLTFEQFLAAVTAATGKTQGMLERCSDAVRLELAYNAPRSWTVEQAVEHYTWAVAENDKMCKMLIYTSMERAHEMQLHMKSIGVDITWDEAFDSVIKEMDAADAAMKGSIAEKLDTDWLDQQH